MRNKKLRSVFTNVARAGNVSYEANPENKEYSFLYYSRYTPYVPLPLVISGKDIIPVAVRKTIGRLRSSGYLKMIKGSFNVKYDYLTIMGTRGGSYYAVGPGCFYAKANRLAKELTPVFVMCIHGSIYNPEMNFIENIHENKMYLEVFMHNDIRSVNSTLWKYIRKQYIPLLQLEGIRFSFMRPEQIQELTTTTYQKPKFTELEQIQAYRESIQQKASLQNAFTNTSIATI